LFDEEKKDDDVCVLLVERYRFEGVGASNTPHLLLLFLLIHTTAMMMDDEGCAEMIPDTRTYTRPHCSTTNRGVGST